MSNDGPSPGPSGRAAGAARQPPGPAPARGVVGKLRYYRRFSTDALGFIGERFDEFGDTYHVPPERPDGAALFVVRHPAQLHQVLVADAASWGKGHPAMLRLRQLLGDGLLTSEGPLWRQHRRMIQPAFRNDRLQHYGAAVVEEATQLAAAWRDQQVVDVAADLSALTVRIVCRTLFSHDATDQTRAVGAAMQVLQDSVLSLDLLPGWLPSPGRARLRRAKADLDDIIFGLVARRRAAGVGGAAGGDSGGADLLDLLLAARDEEGDGAALSDQQVRDHLVTFFLAGHETTSNALAWTLHLLADAPEVADALADEVRAACQDRPPTAADLPALPLGEQVLYEAMRLYPPAYMVARKAVADTRLGEWEVPAGSEVAAWIYWTHRDPRWWAQPDRFRPERFAPGGEASAHPDAWLPFGKGARACIGRHFAMLEARLVLAVLLPALRFAPLPGQVVRPQARVTLTPRGGLRLGVQPRQSGTRRSR